MYMFINSNNTEGIPKKAILGENLWALYATGVRFS